jgi:hypothetical protein
VFITNGLQDFFSAQTSTKKPQNPIRTATKTAIRFDNILDVLDVVKGAGAWQSK